MRAPLPGAPPPRRRCGGKGPFDLAATAVAVTEAAAVAAAAAAAGLALLLLQRKQAAAVARSSGLALSPIKSIVL